MQDTRLSADTELRNLPNFLFKDSVAPVECWCLVHESRIWGMDVTPFFEPDYKVLRKTDSKDKDALVRLQEVRGLLGTKGTSKDEPGSSRTAVASRESGGEMERLFQVLHRALAVVAEDIPAIRELPPAERVAAWLNVYL